MKEEKAERSLFLCKRPKPGALHGFKVCRMLDSRYHSPIMAAQLFFSIDARVPISNKHNLMNY